MTEVPLDGGLFWNAERLLEAVRPTTRLLLLDNPNNPTSTHIGRDALRRLLSGLPDHVIPVIDEAYVHYADAPDYQSALELRDASPNLFVLRTFSKAYGLASTRAGYAIAPSELIDDLERVRLPFNLNGVVQAGALAALDDQEHVARCVELNRNERARVGRALSELGLAVAPSQANFVCVGIARDARAVFDALLARGVIVRTVGGLPQHLRISIGLPDGKHAYAPRLARSARLSSTLRVRVLLFDPTRPRIGTLAVRFSLLACGGGQSTAPAAQGTTAERAGPPALPADPLSLLPAGPHELASADLAQLRASQHFATLGAIRAHLWLLHPRAGSLLLRAHRSRRGRELRRRGERSGRAPAGHLARPISAGRCAARARRGQQPLARRIAGRRRTRCGRADRADARPLPGDPARRAVVRAARRQPARARRHAGGARYARSGGWPAPRALRQGRARAGHRHAAVALGIGPHVRRADPRGSPIARSGSAASSRRSAAGASARGSATARLRSRSCSRRS